MLARLMLHYPDRSTTPEEARILSRDYAEDLAEYPADIVQEGIRNVRRREVFRPKIATLRGEMDKLLVRRRCMLICLRKLRDHQDEVPPTPPTPEQIARVDAALATIRRVPA